jgi:hypothetical protein
MTPWMRTRENFNTGDTEFMEGRFSEDQHIAGEK